MTAQPSSFSWRQQNLQQKNDELRQGGQPGPQNTPFSQKEEGAFLTVSLPQPNSL
jgi:hypothetical protein